ncbi:MAG: 6,7-dimethyl-8-ribityllumazine synthase [Candidatus Omnitrophica bacterium]|nr:6,7-dimethyl-8-ribityllumazine synthase [Candidatus Omnitrophota bacterium]
MSRTEVKIFEGNLTANSTARFAVVVSRFNHFITERLLDGALDAFRRHGISEDQVTVAWVPGAWEIPVVAKRLAGSGQFTAIIGVGAVIRGSTDHYEHVAGEAAKGLAQVATSTGVPALNAVLATDNLEQAIERAGSKQGNKGFEVACAAIEMANLMEQLPPT